MAAPCGSAAAGVVQGRGCRVALAPYHAEPAVPTPALAQTLGEQGDVDAAQAAATEAERLKGQQTALEQAGQARANARAGRNLHQKVRGRTGGAQGGHIASRL